MIEQDLVDLGFTKEVVIGLMYSVIAGLMGILATVAVLPIYYLIIGK
jgi:hypothetical protein